MNSDGAERLWLKIRFAHAWLTTNRTVGSSVCVPSCVPLMIDGASLIHGGRSFVTAQRFQGKIAMVTGGNTGIGLDVAKAVRTGGCARSNQPPARTGGSGYCGGETGSGQPIFLRI